VLLSFLCSLAALMLDAESQPAARVYFGCFAISALIIGTSVEKRFISESIQELDYTDIASGVLLVLGTALEREVEGQLRDIVRVLFLLIPFGITTVLLVEYYADKDLVSLFRRLRNKRTKRRSKKSKPESRYQVRLPRLPEGSFRAKYEVGKKLGKGFFGTVVVAMDRAISKSDDEYRCFAAKCIPKIKLTGDDEQQVRNEIAVLNDIKEQNPYIINIYDSFEEPSHFYIVLELMRGGELFDRIVKKQKYFEKDARIVVRTLASALSFLHGQGIVHRDLKPENILMESEGSNSRIKLADFGFARRVENGCTTACGTPDYVAPEIIDGSVYGVSVDIWALGVITYILLSGQRPFAEENRPKLFKKIRKGEYSMHGRHFQLISIEALDLIRKCLTVNAKHRITADEIMEHRWMCVQGTSEQRLRRMQNSERLDADVAPNGVPELAAAHSGIKLFNARQRLRAGILAAIAANKMSTIVELVKGSRRPTA